MQTDRRYFLIKCLSCLSPQHMCTDLEIEWWTCRHDEHRFHLTTLSRPGWQTRMMLNNHQECKRTIAVIYACIHHPAAYQSHNVWRVIAACKLGVSSADWIQLDYILFLCYRWLWSLTQSETLGTLSYIMSHIIAKLSLSQPIAVLEYEQYEYE